MARNNTRKTPGRGVRGKSRTAARSTKRALSQNVMDALELAFCSEVQLVALLDGLSGGGAQEVDYEVEARFESLAAAIADPKSSVLEVANRRASRGAGLADRMVRRWLNGSVAGCGFETKVRVSEVLAELSVRTREPRTAVAKRLKSKRWEHRMWAARVVRRAGWRDADVLLAPLAEDPFDDDNGLFLVREAAGF
jgi:hypothetical protein